MPKFIKKSVILKEAKISSLIFESGKC